MAFAEHTAGKQLPRQEPHHRRGISRRAVAEGLGVLTVATLSGGAVWLLTRSEPGQTNASAKLTPAAGKPPESTPSGGVFAEPTLAPTEQPAITNTPTPLAKPPQSVDALPSATPSTAPATAAAKAPNTATTVPTARATEAPKIPPTPKIEIIPGATEFTSRYHPYKAQLLNWQNYPLSGSYTQGNLDNPSPSYFSNVTGVETINCPKNSDVFMGGAIVAPGSTQFRTAAILVHTESTPPASGTDLLQKSKSDAETYLRKLNELLNGTKYAPKDAKITTISIGNGRMTGYHFYANDAKEYSSEYIFWNVQGQDGKTSSIRFEIHGDPVELKQQKEIDARTAFLKTWTPTS